MGGVCILIFAIIAILSGLWYGGIDVLPDFEFSGRNVTELCENFNRTEFLNTQNQLLIDEITGSEPAAQQQLESTTTGTLTTTISTTETTTTTTEANNTSWTFDEGRILLYYCRVEGSCKTAIFALKLLCHFQTLCVILSLAVGQTEARSTRRANRPRLCSAF